RGVRPPLRPRRPAAGTDRRTRRPVTAENRRDCCCQTTKGRTWRNAPSAAHTGFGTPQRHPNPVTSCSRHCSLLDMRYPPLGAATRSSCVTPTAVHIRSLGVWASRRGRFGATGHAEPRGVLLYRICTTTHLCRQWPARQRMVGVRSRVIVWCASVSANRTRPALLPAGGSARTIHVSMVWMVAVARFADTLTGPMIWIRGGDTSTWLGQPF